MIAVARFLPPKQHCRIVQCESGEKQKLQIDEHYLAVLAGDSDRGDVGESAAFASSRVDAVVVLGASDSTVDISENTF